MFSKLKILSQFSKFQSIDSKFYYLYGVNPIELAFAAERRKIETLILSDSETVKTSYRATKIINVAQYRKIPIVFSSKYKMSRLVKNQPHQNMIIKCSPLFPNPSLEPSTYPQGLYIYCDKITDPQNFGAIVRTSLFYGVKGIFTSKKNIAPMNSTVSKASSGALEISDIHSVYKYYQFFTSWKYSQGLIISTSVDDRFVYPLSPLQCRNYVIDGKGKYKRVMLVLGSYGSGVSPHLSRNSDISVCIKRTGITSYPHNLVDSLNVNSALSSILYEMTLQE